jgi:hypothetical protein
MHSFLIEAPQWLIISFFDAFFVDGGNETPHLLMHSLLIEATKHHIH